MTASGFCAEGGGGVDAGGAAGWEPGGAEAGQAQGCEGDGVTGGVSRGDFMEEALDEGGTEPRSSET